MVAGERYVDRPPASERPVPGGAAHIAPFTSSAEYLAALFEMIALRVVAALREREARGLLDAPRVASVQSLIAGIPEANDGDAIARRAGLFERRLSAARDRELVLPLADAFDAWGLSPLDRSMVATLLAISHEPVVAQLARVLGTETEVLAAIVGEGHVGALAVAERLTEEAPLIRLGLVTPHGVERPFLARGLVIAARLGALARGDRGLDAVLAATGVTLVRERDPRVADWTSPGVFQLVRGALARGSALPVVWLTAAPGTGGVAIACDAALSLSWTVMRVRRVSDDPAWLDAIAREALLHHSMIVVEYDGRPIDPLAHRLADLPTPIAVVDEHAAIGTTLPALRIALPGPGVGERDLLWRGALAGIQHECNLGDLATSIRVGAQAIERGVAHAVVVMQATGNRRLGRRDLVAGLAAQLPGMLAIEHTTQTWDQLVLPGEVLDRALGFVVAIREQQQADGRLGHHARLAITGPAGTGKTMLASQLASHLELGLVELDAREPAALDTAILAAEQGLVLLAIAHADAAPALVRRLDGVQAPMILIGTSGIAFDRPTLAVALPLPSQDARVRLWELALPAGSLALDELARDYAITGAQIHEIARRVTLATKLDQPITHDLIREIARRTNQESR
ncbi:MAG: hypothetical protein WKG01_06970 [Kofleriaceae bacterium]